MPRRIPYLRPKWNQPAPGVKALRACGPDPEAERRRFYNGARWRRLRLAFLAANPICASCLEAGRVTPATIAHHVRERLADPASAYDPENLRALCPPCHGSVHKSKKPSPREA